MDGKMTDATRYLCAAAYLDIGLRHAVIEQIFHNKYKAMGPSYGVDMIRAPLAHRARADHDHPAGVGGQE